MMGIYTGIDGVQGLYIKESRRCSWEMENREASIKQDRGQNNPMGPALPVSLQCLLDRIEMNLLAEPYF